jgi:hypothetical protein
MDAKKMVPKGANYIGIIHGHPHGKEFSDGDKRYADSRGEYIFVAFRNNNGGADVLSYSGKGKGNTKNPISPIRNAPINKLTYKKKMELRRKFEDKWDEHIYYGCNYPLVECETIKWPRNR